MCVKLPALGCGGWGGGVGCGSSGGSCPGPGDRQVTSEAQRQSRGFRSLQRAAGGTLLWAEVGTSWWRVGVRECG